MVDIKCPFCLHEFDLDGGNGEGVEEGISHIHCLECDEEIEFYTRVSFTHEVLTPTPQSYNEGEAARRGLADFE